MKKKSQLSSLLITAVLIPSFLWQDNCCEAIGPHGPETSLDEGSAAERMSIGLEKTTAKLALAIFRRQFLSRAAVFSCQSSADRRLIRNLASRIQTTIITSTTLWRLDNVYFRTGVLVVMQSCPRGATLFHQGVVQPYVNSTYRWLVVSANPAEDATIFFRNVTFRLDTSITAVLPMKPLDNSYKMLDVYKDALHTHVQTEEVGFLNTNPSVDAEPSILDWIDAENAPFRSRVHRRLETGALVLNVTEWRPTDTIDRFSLLRGHPRVAGQYFEQKDVNVYLAVAHLYNISINLHVWDIGGYRNQYGVFSEIAGALQTGLIEVSATKLLMHDFRIKAMEYLNMCGSFRSGVVYYVGATLDTPGALLEPFAPSLWLAVAAIFSAGVVCLLHVGRIELRSDKYQTDSSIGAAILIILGTFTGQGHPMGFRWYSSRALLAVFLFTGFIVAQAYSAVIIRSLLAAPAPTIRNRADYMKSSLPMAVEDYYHFSVTIFKNSLDGPTKELFENKVRPPKGAGFLTIPAAFQGVLDQKWAMMSMVNNIKVEMAKATPGQVCRLMMIPDLVYEKPICPVVKKKSELKNLLSRGLALAQERGLLNREYNRHHASDIPCLPENQRQWAPVKLQLVLSAVGLVFGGISVGLVFCAVENVVALYARSNVAWKKKIPVKLSHPIFKSRPTVV